MRFRTFNKPGPKVKVKAGMSNLTESYTDEELDWLKFLDKWRTENNCGVWPTMVQILELAKEFLKKKEK